MKQQGVYTERNIDELTPEEQQTIISSRWVHREKGDDVRSRIVAKGFTEHVNDADDIYASAPVFAVLRWLLALSITFSWSITTGDISTAFLHAAAAATAGVALHMYPPTEFYQATYRIVWKLNKALYGLRSSPKAWQDHLADTLHVLHLVRLRTEPNVFKTPGDTSATTAFLIVYVDDLFFLGPRATLNKIFKEIQRPTGDLDIGKTVTFFGRNITNCGTHFEVPLGSNYVTNIIKEAKMETCNPSATPGTAALRATDEHEQDLSKEEHATYRKVVGKLQWLVYTRPDLAYATKELARSLNKPTTQDWKRVKHLVRYLQGTQLLSTPHSTTRNRAKGDRHRRIRRRRLGWRSSHTQVNIRICDLHLGNMRTIREQDTTDSSTQQCRERALCNRHRSHRGSTPPQLSQGATQQHED